jgi:hypothetical protein
MAKITSRQMTRSFEVLHQAYRVAKLSASCNEAMTLGRLQRFHDAKYIFKRIHTFRNVLKMVTIAEDFMNGDEEEHPQESKSAAKLCPYAS